MTRDGERRATPERARLGDDAYDDAHERDGLGAEAAHEQPVDVPVGGRPADYREPRATAAINTTKAVGRGIGRVGRAGGRGAAAAGRFARAKFLGYTRGGGAEQTGLARVAEMHASHAAGDAAMLLALAGTLFFNPQEASARGEVARFLLITMVPFVLTAPFIGPLLDRLGHGRRWAIGVTMAARAFLCWVLGEAISNDSNWLYPAALGCLVASQAYNITKAAAVPRLLPLSTTLVKANSKVAVSGVVGAVVGGALAGAAMAFGPSWALRVAFVIFIVGTVQAIRLPDRVDSSVGEVTPGDTQAVPAAAPPAEQRALNRPGPGPAPAEEHDPIVVETSGPGWRFRKRVKAIAWPVIHALWSSGATRLLTGFLIFFMAFLVKDYPISEASAPLLLGVVAVTIGVGNALGSMVGNALRDHRPEAVAMVFALVALLSCVATGIWYGPWTVGIVGFVQGMSAQVTKLCFDALVQAEVTENARASVFAWSETIRQVLWVIGGALGVLLPLNPHIGFPVAAGAMLGCIVMAMRTRHVAAPRRRRKGAQKGAAPRADADSS